MQYLKFTRLLIEWNKQQNKRLMPWKGEKEPYKVWLSEVILQQTRVEQGWAYYEKFIKKYPTIKVLAKAKDEEVFKLWEGLGYYSRCKNLLHTARFIDKNYAGKFPSTYAEIEALKGIGPYTASAIASFCFNLPYAVLDGNVFRVLSRVFGISTPVDSTEGKKQFKALADKVLDKSDPGGFNQAIMDFGAIVCKPALPACFMCNLNKICIAYKTASVNKLPVKQKILKKKQRWFSYVIFECGGKTLVRKRTQKDIWQNLFEFYLVESASDPVWDKKNIADFFQTQLGIKQYEVKFITSAEPQKLTHQHITGFFITVKLQTIPAVLKAMENLWLSDEEINNLPFPGFINQYFEKKNMQVGPF
ncbi:MAG: A/G-specific adenine glycosylase [Panacibacter sp.]